MEIRKYMEKDISAMVYIWNKVVEDGEAFPQEDFLNDNFAIENGKKTVFDILNQQKCSMCDMEHRMKKVCDALITEYQETMEEFRPSSLETRVTLERDLFGIGKNIRFELPIQRLRQDIWEK